MKPKLNAESMHFSDKRSIRKLAQQCRHPDYVMLALENVKRLPNSLPFPKRTLYIKIKLRELRLIFQHYLRLKALKSRNKIKHISHE